MKKKFKIAEGQSLIFDSPAYKISRSNFFLFTLESCPLTIRSQERVSYVFPNDFFSHANNSVEESNSQIFVAKKTGTYHFRVTVDSCTLPPSTMTVYIK